MTEISFYHLTKTPIEKALPQLLLKIIASNKNAILMASSAGFLAKIDALLWTFSTNKIIPHGTKEYGYVEDHPVYLTLQEENPNNASTLVTIEGSKPSFISKFERCVDIFDGNNEDELSKARERWKDYKQNSEFSLLYWHQDEKGTWVKVEK